MAGRVVLQLMVRLSFWSGHRQDFERGSRGMGMGLHRRSKEHARRDVDLGAVVASGPSWLHWPTLVPLGGEKRRDERVGAEEFEPQFPHVSDGIAGESSSSPSSVSTSSSCDGGPRLPRSLPTCASTRKYLNLQPSARDTRGLFCGKGERVTPHYTLAG